MTSQPQGCRNCETPGAPVTRRSSKGGFADGSSALLVAAALFITLLVVSCGKSETVKAPAPAVSPKPPAVSDAHLDSMITQALEPTKIEKQDALADEADDIIAKYPNKNAAELLNVPEVNESLKVALTKLGQDKALQGQINSTVELAAKMQGLEGKPGSVGLDMDLKNYDPARKARLLQAVLSEDPKRIVGFLVEEIGEATPELTFEGVYRAKNGVAIKENNPPPASAK